MRTFKEKEFKNDVLKNNIYNAFKNDIEDFQKNDKNKLGYVVNEDKTIDATIDIGYLFDTDDGQYKASFKNKKQLENIFNSSAPCINNMDMLYWLNCHLHTSHHLNYDLNINKKSLDIMEYYENHGAEFDFKDMKIDSSFNYKSYLKKTYPKMHEL